MSDICYKCGKEITDDTYTCWTPPQYLDLDYLYSHNSCDLIAYKLNEVKNERV